MLIGGTPYRLPCLVGPGLVCGARIRHGWKAQANQSAPPNILPASSRALGYICLHSTSCTALDSPSVPPPQDVRRLFAECKPEGSGLEGLEYRDFARLLSLVAERRGDKGMEGVLQAVLASRSPIVVSSLNAVEFRFANADRQQKLERAFARYVSRLKSQFAVPGGGAQYYGLRRTLQVRARSRRACFVFSIVQDVKSRCTFSSPAKRL